MINAKVKQDPLVTMIEELLIDYTELLDIHHEISLSERYVKVERERI